jgi:uncharacterized repeat protein (TIGR01451 family)
MTGLANCITPAAFDLNGCSVSDVDHQMMVKSLSRLTALAFALGGALFLLCTCAVGEHTKATAADLSPSGTTVAPTAIPTDESWPVPLPLVEPTSNPLTQALIVTEQGPDVADLAIEVREPVRLVPDETIVYTLTLRNHGPGPATGLLLTDVLSSGATPLWAQPGEPVCQRAGREVSCDVGALPAGEAVFVNLDLSIGGTEAAITGTQPEGVRVDLSVPTCAISGDAAQSLITCRLARLPAGAEAQVRIGLEVDTSRGSIRHTATIEGNETDPVPSNNSATFRGMVESLDEVPAAEGVVGTTTDLVLQADGPSAILAGRPFTYTYTITNRGTLAASNVQFEDALPSDLELVTYAPGPPRCEQRGDAFTCALSGLDSGEAVTFTLVITGHSGQSVRLDLDPLLPGWPTCYVIKERTWLHIVRCALGSLQPAQSTHVRLVLSAVGVQARTTANAASVTAREEDLDPTDNTITTTLTVQTEAEP